jgi:glyoxylase-like metal-dependent hydrolase (beta-lactamase superfamily II)
MSAAVGNQDSERPLPSQPPGAPLRIDDLGGGAWCVGNGVYQALILDAGSGTALVDAPPSLAPSLPAAIAATVGRPVSHLFYSHAHGDHIGAAGAFFGPNVQVIAHETTAALLGRHADPNRPVPTTTFSSSTTIELGHQRLELSHRGPNHSPDNIFVHLPHQRAVMLVDVVFAGTAPFRGLTAATDVPGLLAAHDELLGIDADTFIGGHFTRLGARHDITAARLYLHDLVRATADALGAVSFKDVAAQVTELNGWPPHPYEVAAAFDARVAATARTELLPRWQDRLEGLDVFIDSSITAMADSLRWDYNTTGGGAPPATSREKPSP